MEYDNTPYICAECVHLDLGRQQSDHGEKRYFYLCEKKRIFVDSRDMLRRCSDRKKRNDHEEMLIALRGERKSVE